MPPSKPRRKASLKISATKEDDGADAEETAQLETPRKRSKRGPQQKNAKEKVTESVPSSSHTKRRAISKSKDPTDKGIKKSRRLTDGHEDGDDPPAEKENLTKKKVAGHQRVTDRVDLPKLWDGEKALKNGSYS